MKSVSFFFFLTKWDYYVEGINIVSNVLQERHFRALEWLADARLETNDKRATIYPL